MMRLNVILLAALPLVLASCDKASTITAVPIEQTDFNSSLGVNLSASTKTGSGLYYRDIRVGTGATIGAGTRVTVKYVGALANGTQFDAGTLPAFTVPGPLIPGFNEGLLGMKLGGSRQIIIPSALGYGAQGSPPKIPPHAVLVFTIEPT